VDTSSTGANKTSFLRSLERHDTVAKAAPWTLLPGRSVTRRRKRFNVILNFEKLLLPSGRWLL
jgi:hypothetical protein